MTFFLFYLLACILLFFWGEYVCFSLPLSSIRIYNVNRKDLFFYSGNREPVRKISVDQSSYFLIRHSRSPTQFTNPLLLNVISEWMLFETPPHFLVSAVRSERSINFQSKKSRRMFERSYRICWPTWTILTSGQKSWTPFIRRTTQHYFSEHNLFIYCSPRHSTATIRYFLFLKIIGSIYFSFIAHCIVARLTYICIGHRFFFFYVQANAK